MNGAPGVTNWKAAGMNLTRYIAIAICTVVLQQPMSAQDAQLPTGFQRISGQYIDIVTDLPLSDSLRELPAVFDAAIPIWCKAFGVKLSEVQQWHVEGYVMRARERFLQADLLPGDLPNFPYGFQYGNRVWVSEQDTEYYHRHLLLHEGTHWFMNRKFGNHGPPWVMEGLAEWYGTHYWDGTNLRMGVVPKSRQDVPGWGRISLIQEQLETGIASSLETILRYDNRAHQQAEAYAWSWAAVLFFMHHPDTKTAFSAMLKQPMKTDQTQTLWLFKRLKEKWPSLRQSWNATITDLEYGFDPGQKLLAISSELQRLDGPSKSIEVLASQGWQGSGIVVREGQMFSIQAHGEYIVGDSSGPWNCQPDGVTLEYYRGEPLGKIVASILAPLPKEPDFATPVRQIPIGSRAEITASRTGELFFRVNESVEGLGDNSGKIDIVVAP